MATGTKEQSIPGETSQQSQKHEGLDPEIQNVVATFSKLRHDQQEICIEAMTAVYVAKAKDGVSERELLQKIQKGFSTGLKFLEANIETRDKGKKQNKK